MRRMIIMKNNSSNRKTTSIQVDENTAPLHMDPLRIPLNYNDEALKHTEFRQGSKSMRSPLASLDSVQNIIAGDSSTQQSSLSNIQTKTTYQKTRKRKDPCSEVSPLSVLNTNIQIPSPRVNNVGYFPGL
ncbi:uncharacterized protein LOC130709987 [Lotus japonicus]|uniref:uncharacterized protein LOC130709987 n=1 Tax=Lotus japonicus TaxID=34305 RepID=UPI00258EBB25|nr:uncharacterized protein LOC130709987 [Lotus japonicus]